MLKIKLIQLFSLEWVPATQLEVKLLILWAATQNYLPNLKVNCYLSSELSAFHIKKHDENTVIAIAQSGTTKDTNTSIDLSKKDMHIL